jgi:CdiI immunity protein
MLDAFFHQDAFDDGETSEEIVREFASVAQPYDVLGVRADIRRFLAQVPAGRALLPYFDEILAPDLILANDDEELKNWLGMVLTLRPHADAAS